MGGFLKFFKINQDTPYLYTEESRREYLTRVIFAMVTIITGVFSIILFTGFFAGAFSRHVFIILPVLLASGIGWYLSNRGCWRYVNFIPIVLFFLLGLYGSVYVGATTTCLVFYILATILSNMLFGTKGMILVMAASVLAHYGLSYVIFQESFELLLPSILIFCAAFVTIGLLQWLSTTLLKQALAQSMHDALTGLYNRAFYDAEIERLNHSRHYPVSVLVCDLNDLKKCNDKLGHGAGDLLLSRAASAMKAVFRKEDAACRTGGDEFAVFLPETDENAAIRAVDRLREKITQDNLAYQDLHLNLAIGWATCAAGEDLTGALRMAERCMYQNKEQMKKQGVIFKPASFKGYQSSVDAD